MPVMTLYEIIIRVEIRELAVLPKPSLIRTVNIPSPIEAI